MISRLLLAGACLSFTSFAHAAWTVTLLHPAGTTKYASYAQALDATHQAGYVQVGGDYHAAYWSGTSASFVDFNPTNASYSTITGIDGNLQVGSVAFTGSSRAALWSGSAASYVDLTPAGKAPANILASGGGIQAGIVTVNGKQHASAWLGTAASWVDLHPAGFSYSEAYGSGGGKQVGHAFTGSVSHAFMWSGTEASKVDLHPAGRDSSIALCTDGATQGGYCELSGTRRATFWGGTAATFHDLHPPNAVLSAIYGVAGPYQVGEVNLSRNHATLWKGTLESMVDLHQFLPGNWTYSRAQAVYLDGSTVVVVGFGFNEATQKEEAVMWRQSDPNDFALTLNKTQVAGQNSVQGTITLVESKTSSTVVTTYDNSSLVTTPATVTVPANATVKNFQITVTAVTSTINTTIYAKLGSITRSQPLALVPLVPTALAFTPSLVTGGQTTSCKVVINGVAGPSGRVIAILDNSSYATVPATVTVPPGASSVTFNITTAHPATQQLVTVTARVSAGEKTGTFRINP